MSEITTNKSSNYNYEDMKCCGNCVLFFSMSECLHSNSDDSGYCDSWIFDGMKQDERRIE